MQGNRVLVTAGPTQESIDPVRFITNHSTGKMGYAIAKMCMLRGAEVTLVSGPTSIAKPEFVHVVDVVTAKEMYEEVTKRAKDQDIIIKAAAVADYRPKSVSSEKMKKKDDDLAIPMERTDDILKFLGEQHLDMIVANNLKVEGAGFAGDTNVVTIITGQEEVSLGKMTKEETALRILDEILKATN